ncbi:MAG: PIN domain nuclease [Treponema sp.]|nr:PIN domain nuclease [Treponema sp.]
MVVVDTTVWIDYIHGLETPHTDALDYELLHNQVITGDLLITEFLQGFRNDSDFEAAKKIMNSLIYFDMLGKEIALKSAVNFRLLRKQGITIRKTADIIIGTFCIENELPLLHSDRDYEPMERYLGLQIYKNW